MPRVQKDLSGHYDEEVDEEYGLTPSTRKALRDGRGKPRKRGSAASAPASAATRRRQSAAGQAAAPHQQQPREEQGVRCISGLSRVGHAIDHSLTFRRP